MKVKELIKLLERFEPDQLVLFGANGRDENYYDENIVVEDALVYTDLSNNSAMGEMSHI